MDRFHRIFTVELLHGGLITMRLSELQRKAALLEYYLRREGKFPDNVNAEIEPLGITRQAFDKWRNGETIDPYTARGQKGTKNRKPYLPPIPQTLQTMGVMELGRALGLSRAECRKAIDTLTIELLPSFSRFSLDRPQAKGLLDVYRGLYRIYRIEDTEEARAYTGRDWSILCMTLAVRYGVRGGKTYSRDERRIRCKLSVPAYNRPIFMYEYDGYMTPADSGRVHYWMFEARKEIETDLAMLMTSQLSRSTAADGRSYMLGTFHSRTQEEHSRPAIWPVVIERIADLPAEPLRSDQFDEDPEYEFTRANAVIADPATISPWVLEMLARSGRFARVMPSDILKVIKR